MCTSLIVQFFWFFGHPLSIILHVLHSIAEPVADNVIGQQGHAQFKKKFVLEVEVKFIQNNSCQNTSEVLTL